MLNEPLLAFLKLALSDTCDTGLLGYRWYTRKKFLNSGQVKIKYEFAKPFRSRSFSKDENHAELEQFLWPFSYLQNNYKTIIQ